MRPALSAIGTPLCAALCAGLVGCLPAGVRASPLAAFAPPIVLVAMSPATCRIEAERRAGLVHLTGIVEGHEPMRGNAWMRVRRSGRAGTSDNTQGGMFAIGANEIATVGRVAVSAGPNDRLTAELTVEWDGGRTACSYP